MSSNRILELSKDDWKVRLFNQCQLICDNFTDSNKHGFLITNTNLCYFIRVIFIYAPTIILLNLALYALSIYILIVVPIQYFGEIPYIYTTGSILILISLLYLVNRMIANAPVEHETEVEEEKESEQEVKPKEDKEPSWRELLKVYLKAKKEKICPTIQITDCQKEVHNV
jgi:hypothetical protein